MKYARLIPLLFLGLAACDGADPVSPGARLTAEGPMPALPQPEPSVPADSGRILLSGAAAVVGNENPPQWVHVSVSAFNGGTKPYPLSELCVVQVQAFRGATASARPAWVSAAQAASSCDVSGLTTLPVGSKYWLRGADAGVTLPALLGDSLPAGSYRFEALVRVGRDTVRVPAGTLQLLSDPRPPLRDPALLKYAIETRVDGVAPKTLQVRVAVTNPTDRPFYLEFGSCALHVHAYRTAARTGNPVWRSEYSQPYGIGVPRGCLDYLATKLLLPGASFAPPEFSAAIPMEEILADSLPAGHYYFLAEVIFQQGGGTTLTNPSVWLSAGEADLTMTVDPLPQERESAGLRYRGQVAEDPATPGAVRFSLSVTNTGASRTFLAQYVTGCNVQLYGYATAAARDVAYRGGQPDLRLDACPVTIPPTWLEPGETRTFTGTASPPPGTPRKRYWFAAFVFALPQPQGVQTVVSLSGGDAVAGGN